jgi:hypothetical protein
MPRLTVSPHTSRKLAEFLAIFRGIAFYSWKTATATRVKHDEAKNHMCCIGTTRRIHAQRFAPRVRSGVHYRIRRIR